MAERCHLLNAMFRHFQIFPVFLVPIVRYSRPLTIDPSLILSYYHSVALRRLNLAFAVLAACCRAQRGFPFPRPALPFALRTR